MDMKNLDDSSWVKKIWDWADDNDLDDKLISRDKDKLLSETHLTLKSQLLTEIPKEIFYLKELEALDLSDNLLKKIPEEIGNLSKLEYLFLDNNLLNE